MKSRRNLERHFAESIEFLQQFSSVHQNFEDCFEILVCSDPKTVTAALRITEIQLLVLLCKFIILTADITVFTLPKRNGNVLCILKTRFEIKITTDDAPSISWHCIVSE